MDRHRSNIRLTKQDHLDDNTVRDDQNPKQEQKFHNVFLAMHAIESKDCVIYTDAT